MERSIPLELPIQLKDFNDDLLDEAIHFVLSSARASPSAVQRHFRIGYNRAASLIEAMEARGIVSKMAEDGTRIVIADNSTNVVLPLVDKKIVNCS